MLRSGLPLNFRHCSDSNFDELISIRITLCEMSRGEDSWDGIAAQEVSICNMHVQHECNVSAT